MDAIVIMIGLALLIGVSLGFWLGILVTTLLADPEPGKTVTGRPTAYGHAVSAWWR